MEKKEKVFALDIGTRSVVGIILEEHEKDYKIMDMISKEHRERAMLDGQIHDVPAVSTVISEIKKELEVIHGPLKNVCVAAAGRALKTEFSSASLSINGKPLLTQEDILHLELSAVQQAQAKAAQNEFEESYHYYCVGYSVLHYKLDGEEIGSLIDQQGEMANVEIIATFLPKVVVESLISALHRSQLEMEALTLEPIAAINVLIPLSMRRLNVALIDIGAGTSDIAITDRGTVIAFGMVPTAGDEITEAFSDEFLLDFPFAEQAKRLLSQQSSIKIQDILGFENTLSREEVEEKLAPAINHLAQKISSEILRLNNQKAPKAVMLVGGGSLTPNITDRIAECLQLPTNRVAIRGSEAISELTISDENMKGPKYVTPIGIAIAAKKAPVQYITAYVNDKPIRMFEVKQLTVGDCLLAAGINVKRLYGKPGLAIMAYVNNQAITLPGTYGTPPSISINDEHGSLETAINNGDRITVEKGEDGHSPHIKISDLLDAIPTKNIKINNKSFEVSINVKKNGNLVGLNEIVSDQDRIEVEQTQDIKDVFLQLGYQKYLTHPFRVTINGKDTFFPAFTGKLKANGIDVKPTYIVQNNDSIEYNQPENPTLQMILAKKQMNLEKEIMVFFHEEEVRLKKQIGEVLRNNKKLSLDCLIQSGDSIQYKINEDATFIFQDIFRHVEIEMPTNAKGKFILLKNGEETSFYDSITTGDRLQISWPLVSNEER
ncbi:cell division protein FtsA [Rossellomorea sp. BNER]|uniref:cell division protein FtsA n=1 Tax=Rossellomorea sp. BNER TaxID=2962031 RepID=UPI003AF2B2A2|nr:pilus assembly protein PilM [Rossellomorea sp. BNER]